MSDDERLAIMANKGQAVYLAMWLTTPRDFTHGWHPGRLYLTDAAYNSVRPDDPKAHLIVGGHGMDLSPDEAEQLASALLRFASERVVRLYFP